jgi:hypothetical protein
MNKTEYVVTEKDLAGDLRESWRVVKVDGKPIWKKLN